MSQRENYAYESLENYSKINSEIIKKEQRKHESLQNRTKYSVRVEYYYPSWHYYLIIPRNYLNNVDYLRRTKNDIFAKGKILRFTADDGYQKPSYFDAVMDFSEEDQYKKGVVYAYLVPIRNRYRYSKNKELVGNYTVQERSGDLTYDRMNEALDQFSIGGCCSKNITKYILGDYIKYIKYLDNIFNYNRYYQKNISGFYRLNYPLQRKIEKIFYNEMNTIYLKSEENIRLICMIIYAIYQMRQDTQDKILVCSSSNNSADTIALELLRMKNCVKRLNVLRIYAKNQEIIKRHEQLKDISYHNLVLKEKNNYFGNRDKVIEKSSIVVSTCVNSYSDRLINYDFPFVIIVDADDSSENENLIPITLNAKHVILIAYENSSSTNVNMYKRMKNLYPNNHIIL